MNYNAVKNFFVKLVRITTISTAVVSMNFSQLAMAAKAEQSTKSLIQQYIKDSKLDRGVTYKEFWEQNKELFRQNQGFAEFERYFTKFPNAVMPKMTVSESKNSLGEKIPVITISGEGKQYTLQYLGTPDKYMKFNNVNLTELDVKMYVPAVRKIAASDINVRRAVDEGTELDPASKPALKVFPNLALKTWKKMTPEQKATYIIRLREVYNDSLKVLELSQGKKAGKKTSQFNFLMHLLENEAFARTTDKSVVGQPCIVNDFRAAYSWDAANGNAYCDYNKRDLSELPPEIKAKILKDDEYCKSTGSTSFACNRVIISGDPNTGNPYCLNKADTQVGTVGDKDGCDTKRPLGKSPQVPFLKDPKKKVGRYLPDNLLDINLGQEYKKQQTENKSYVEDFLKGNGVIFKDGKIADQSFELVRQIKTQFDISISKAEHQCSDSANRNREQETNFWDACDQLHRRFLFVKEYLNQPPMGCENGEVTDSLVCSCPNDKVVNPGSSCNDPGLAGEPQKPSDAVPLAPNCEEEYPGAGTTPQYDHGITVCKCEGGSLPTQEPLGKVDNDSKDKSDKDDKKRKEAIGDAEAVPVSSHSGESFSKNIFKSERLPASLGEKNPVPPGSFIKNKSYSSTSSSKKAVNSEVQEYDEFYDRKNTSPYACSDKKFNWKKPLIILAALAGAAAVGYGIYKLVNKDKKKPPVACVPTSCTPYYHFDSSPGVCKCVIDVIQACQSPKGIYNGYCQCNPDTRKDCAPPQKCWYEDSCQCSYHPPTPTTHRCANGIDYPLTTPCPTENCPNGTCTTPPGNPNDPDGGGIPGKVKVKTGK